MIKIRLKPTVFAPGGMFFGKRNAVLSLNSGKAEDNWIGKRNPVYSASHDFWRGNESAMLIDGTGIEIADVQFSNIMQNSMLRFAWGDMILDFMDRNLIEVSQDGIVLTQLQVSAFTAP